MIGRAAEIRAQIERSASWWADHGPAVRKESNDAYREHCGRMLTDFQYREQYKRGEQMNAATVRRQGLNAPSKPSKPYPNRLQGGLCDKGDRISIDPESTGFDSPDYQHSYLTQQNFFRQDNAEKQFLEFAQAETGMELSPKEYTKLKKGQRVTMAQSRGIAAKLIAAGESRVTRMREIIRESGAPVSEYEMDIEAAEIRAAFDPMRHDAYSLWVYWLHSDTLEQMPQYRRTCLLPYIAAMTRAPKLAALEYWIQQHPYCRFWTFTTGARCTVHELPSRIDWLFSKLRSLNKKLFKKWGLSIVFRTTEFGSLEKEKVKGVRPSTPQMELNEDGSETIEGSIERSETGEAMYHPHAHCVLYSSAGYIQPSTWDKVIEFVNKAWRKRGERIHWDAGKIIGDARECCKYVTKPGDILKLTDSELADFADAVRGRRMVRPMGPLAAEIRDRKEHGRILRRSRAGSRMVWAVKLNQNRLTSETEEEKAARENLEDAYAFTEECEALANIEPPSYPGALDGGTFAPKVIDVETTKVLARIGPAAGPSPIKEPRVILMTNRDIPDMRTVRCHPLVARLWAQTVPEWEAGQALARISVHTGTLSGSVEEHDFPGWERPPDYDPGFAPDLPLELPVKAR